MEFTMSPEKTKPTVGIGAHPHTHTRLRPKTTTLPHSTKPAFLNFYLLMLGFG